MKTRINKGFTLLEILLVIGAIGILASIVIVAINPLRQIEKVRDAERRSEINQLNKAIEQYNISEGKYPDKITVETEDIYKEICNTGKLKESDPLDANFCDGKIDLRVLVPTYVAEIPRDSSLGAIVYSNIFYELVDASDEASTGYEVAVNTDNNKISLKATNTDINEQEIAINLIYRPTVPEQITDLNGVVSNGNIDLTWSTPYDGKSPITGYRVEYSKDNFATQTDITLGVTNQTQISGITVAGEYKVRVYAINALGNGGTSNLATANFGVPSSIEDLVVNESSGNMTLNWTEPNLNGGSLNSYKIRYSDDDFGTYTEITLGNVLSHNFTITDNGVYKFKVLAENQYGIGEDPTNLVSILLCNVTTCTNNNGANVTISTDTTYTTDQINIGILTINSGKILTTSKKIDANITNVNGTLTSTLGTSIDLTTNDLNIASGESINVNDKGYQGGYNGNTQNNGYGPGGGTGGATSGTTYGGGGGYGGAGGNSNTVTGGVQYGSIENPNEMGSGGGSGFMSGAAQAGANGGGVIRLVIGGNANIVGSISANGQNAGGSGVGGGGAGGSINLDIGGVWSGTGSITANGGISYYYGNGGNGAGGRIAVRYGSKIHSGIISVNGGSTARPGSLGGAGSIYQLQE